MLTLPGGSPGPNAGIGWLGALIVVGTGALMALALYWMLINAARGTGPFGV